jgi:NADH-quinone oxidoreductase subunit D
MDLQGIVGSGISPVDVDVLSHESMEISMGPQHPSTHGVLRVLLDLEGEVIRDAKPVIGYLHSGFEKLYESKTYLQGVTLCDRMDYLAPLLYELAYALSVEQLAGIEVPERCKYIRVTMAELQRIASHLVWLGTHAMDIGAMTVFLYCMRERESILNLIEMIVGGRITPAYIRPGGLANDISPEFMKQTLEFTDVFPSNVDEYEALLTENQIWLERTKGVGILTREMAINYGASGPMIRGAGIRWDIRKARPYSGYEKFEFEVPIGQSGDSYDRYLVRLVEMRQSTRIIRQAIEEMPEGPIYADAPQIVPPTDGRVNHFNVPGGLVEIEGSRDIGPLKKHLARGMEELIRHFMIVTEGYRLPAGEAYVPIESSKGELGFYIVSDGSSKPYRVRVRPPAFINLQALPEMVRGRLVADVVTTIGSIDIVLGEVDR